MKYLWYFSFYLGGKYFNTPTLCLNWIILNISVPKMWVHQHFNYGSLNTFWFWFSFLNFELNFHLRTSVSYNYLKKRYKSNNKCKNYKSNLQNYLQNYKSNLKEIIGLFFLVYFWSTKNPNYTQKDSCISNSGKWVRFGK